MNLATWSIRNPIPTIILFAFIALFGLWSFRNLAVQNIPDIDLPTVSIALTQLGAAPAQLETEVARRVEDSVAALSGLKHIRTSITDGRVSILVEFLLEKPLSEALIETKDAVDRVRSVLPPDLEQPSVSAVTVGAEAMLVYAMASPRMSEEELSWFVDDTVNKTVSAVPGVGRFERIGGVQREVRIEADPVRLAAQGVTAADISRALRQVQLEVLGRPRLLGRRAASRQDHRHGSPDIGSRGLADRPPGWPPDPPGPSREGHQLDRRAHQGGLARRRACRRLQDLSREGLRRDPHRSGDRLGVGAPRGRSPLAQLHADIRLRCLHAGAI